VSTTVDETLLSRARGLKVGKTDAALLDEALKALFARHRSSEIDALYAAYDQHPLDEPSRASLSCSDTPPGHAQRRSDATGVRRARDSGWLSRLVLATEPMDLRVGLIDNRPATPSATIPAFTRNTPIMPKSNTSRV
jgi:hypothetical protein